MTGIIILAAGSSSRLGSPKQNLIYEGQTLLQRAIKTAQGTGCYPIIVVLGANFEVIHPTVENLPVTVVYNRDWQEGMSSSIRLGVSELQKEHTKIDSVILMLCDQPFVDTELLNQLILSSAKKSVVVCAYNSGVGPPAFFDGYYFPELLLLQGNEGAKKLILKHEAHITTIPFPLGNIDIDTLDDFERLKKQQNHDL
ncbi:NTP transferase domain-containing protein [Mucilaginibacter sp. OK098]|uniref:nucleotidyltransferase family protein n=1 Tax=Mucilaginibacter sp. OK098 TaxID=1855297 RepID=UPI000921134F|nr:nucleotidyltransferase family protein [Mucilaginibacter sp. OK098]SHM15983.1 molybdenum cofactor cytidylyltransferase [Mucilaginibacter sp. OK098]